MPVQPFQSQGSLVGFNEYKPNFIGRPVEALGSMIGKFDANNQAILDESNAMDLALSSIDLMPEDRKYLVEQRDKFRQGVQGIIDDENYNLAGARINKMAREFQGNEAIKASLGNKQTFEANRADLKKRYDDGKLDYQAYRRGLDQLYSPTLQDGDGFYSKFVPEEFVNKYDFDSILSKRTANWRPDLKSGPLTHVPATATVPEHYKTTTEEFIRPEQVRSGLETALATDPDAMAYAEQVSRLNPEQYPDAQSVINAQIQSYVDKTALDRKGESYPGFGASLSGSKGKTTPISFSEHTPSIEFEGGMANVLDALTKRKRLKTDGKFGEYSTGISGLPKFATPQYKAKGTPSPIIEDTYGFSNLNEEETHMLNSISLYKFGNNLSDIPEDKKEQRYKDIATYIEGAYKDIQVQAGAESLDEDTRKYISNYVFGGLSGENTTVKQAKNSGNANVAGAYLDRTFLDPITGKPMTGKQFKEDVLDKYDDDLIISINTRLSPKHRITGLAGGDMNFAVAYDINIGGDRFIMSGAHGGETIDGKNITDTYKFINNAYQASTQSSVPMPMEVKLPDNTKVKTSIIYQDGVYVLEVPTEIAEATGKQLITATSPEQLGIEYVKLFN